jgi:hypothetical protein
MKPKEDPVIDNLNETDAADFPNCVLFGFAVNGSTLLHRHKTFVSNELHDRLKKVPTTDTAFIDITGTCSFTGSKDYNLALGLRRATAVYKECEAAGLMRLPNVQWNDPQTQGYGPAEGMEKHPPRLSAIREAQGAIFRAVDVNIIIRHSKVPPPPSPPRLHFFQMRAIYALSLSPPIPIFPGVSIGADIMMFEIKDLLEGKCATYRYTGFNFTLGIPLDKLEKAVKMGRLTKIVVTAPGVASGAFAGPFNDFTHRRGPRVYKPVNEWYGPANYFSVSFFNASGMPSWINFGGYDSKPPLRHNARIDPFDGGATIGFPQISTGEGGLTLVTGPQTCR